MCTNNWELDGAKIRLCKMDPKSACFLDFSSLMYIIVNNRIPDGSRPEVLVITTIDY